METLTGPHLMPTLGHLQQVLEPRLSQSRAAGGGRGGSAAVTPNSLGPMWMLEDGHQVRRGAQWVRQGNAQHEAVPGREGHQG